MTLEWKRKKKYDILCRASPECCSRGLPGDWWAICFIQNFNYQKSSVVDPDPYHLARSGSVSNDTDPDPGSAKNQKHAIKNQNCP